jgi:hypothetical protein
LEALASLKFDACAAPAYLLRACPERPSIGMLRPREEAQLSPLDWTP